MNLNIHEPQHPVNNYQDPTYLVACKPRNKVVYPLYRERLPLARTLMEIHIDAVVKT